MKKRAVVEKAVGQTPLECLEQYREAQHIGKEIPIAYAGRLDPMASGKLLLLIGDECKKQTTYHNLDKEYVFEVLFEVSSDTGDVLGIVHTDNAAKITHQTLTNISKCLVGDIELPYPHFSSKTVSGIPLHTWALQGRLSEVDIPVNKTRVHSLKLIDIQTAVAETVVRTVREKIALLPEVTDEKKALGRDFRRKDVLSSWDKIQKESPKTKQFTIATFRCVCSSGTYMRSLAQEIGKQAGTVALAFSIHRTTIGRYHKLPFGFGYWRKKY